MPVAFAKSIELTAKCLLFQVSPTAAFIKEDDIVELKARLFASRHPYANFFPKVSFPLRHGTVSFRDCTVRNMAGLFVIVLNRYVEQLLPGRSIFDLAQTCYSTARVALNEHFRCVPQCIALSNEQVCGD